MKFRQASAVKETEGEILARYALGHGQGLVFAYALEPGVAPCDIAMNRADDSLAAGRGLIWIHLDLTTTPAKRWIETRDWLPESAKEILLTREDHTQFQHTGSGLTGVICDFHHELAEVEWRVGKLHFYVDEHRLITGRRHPLAALERAQQEVLKGGVSVASGIELLSLVIEALAELLDGANEALTREIERAEDHIERDHVQHLRAGLGEVRKRAILFHRQIHNERRVMARLVAHPPAWFRAEDTARLREAFEHLVAIAEELDTLEVRAKLMQDELAARLAEATNRNLYVLSVVSVVLLPMSLIAGMFGMNQAGLPWLNSPEGFWYGSGIIAFVGIFTLLLLRLTKVL